jgi:GTP-binding protein YchF
MYTAEKVVPATVTFVDIAGLVEGASKGEGLGNKFLANIRQCDAIVHIVRAFENSDIVRHDNGEVNPKNDIEIINTELILADLQTIEKRMTTLAKEAKAKPTAREQLSYIESLQRHLEGGTPLSALPSLNHELIADLHLLTAKPVIYAFNVDEATLVNPAAKHELEMLASPSEALFVCAKLEEELKGLDAADAHELLGSYGVEQSGLEQMIHAAYKTLGLQSYLTAGQKEVRAWTIRAGMKAPQAAGVIHTDFEKGFIRAEVIAYDDYVASKGEVGAREKGQLRLEGKDYVMKDGDVVHFHFSN